MKRLIPLLLLWALLLPAVTSAEKILWEDEEGQVILEDDGDIDFVPAGTQPADTPAAVSTPLETQSPTPEPTPLPTATPVPPLDQTLQYGDSGEAVLAAQERLTDLGYYHGKCSVSYTHLDVYKRQR